MRKQTYARSRVEYEIFHPDDLRVVAAGSPTVVREVWAGLKEQSLTGYQLIEKVITTRETLMERI